MGLLTARELRRAGVSVTVVERGATGQESSWAGGGILSSLYPWRDPQAVTALIRWSQEHYPLLARALVEETGDVQECSSAAKDRMPVTGMDVEWIQNGLLILESDEKERALTWANQTGVKLSLINRAEMLQHEPLLGVVADEAVAPGILPLATLAPSAYALPCTALWLPDVAQIRSPRLLKALRHSLLASGVVIKEQTEITRLIVRDGSIEGVETANGPMVASKVVVTAGAWSDNLLKNIGFHSQISQVVPVRGQMILFRAIPELVTRIVVHKNHYIIPRRDGRVLAGSTVEYAGFDKSTTEHALTQLREMALALVPELSHYEVEHHWAGLRPGLASERDGVPYIGEHPGVSGLFVNTGHFRNGVVMAPASARLLADIIFERVPIVDPAPYRMDAL